MGGGGRGVGQLYLARAPFQVLRQLPVVRLASWLRSFFYSTIAGSRKSKVWVANDRFSGGRKKLRHGTNRWPVRPRRLLLQAPEPKTAQQACIRLHVTTRGLTVRVSFQGCFFTSHSARRVSHVACHMTASSSNSLGSPSEVQHRFIGGFICGSVTLTCRWPRSSSPILLIFLHLWFHLALFCSACPDFRFHQEPPYLLGRPRRMAACFLNWPLCPLPVSNSSLGRTPTMAPG